MASSSTTQCRPMLLTGPVFPFNEVPPNIPPQAFSDNQNVPIFPKLKFVGWQTACPEWEDWVSQMHDHYQSTWKMAGIYEAIMSSVFHINCDKGLVLALTNKWFPETNTFFFTRREQSVTLEDIFVLGGYSVLGECARDPTDRASQNSFRQIKKRLADARRVLNNTSIKKVVHSDWINLFTTPNSTEFDDIKHEAFLVLWLSKFVFPMKNLTVGKNVHNLAIRLSRGTKIALAPAVLASIYRDLTTLKNAFPTPREELVISSPMHFVQIWAWERFKLAEPLIIVHGQPIMARWHCVNPTLVNDIANSLDTRGFYLRPYTRFLNFNEMARNMYRENQRVVLDCSNFEPDIEAFVRFIRPSELVGIDCIEQYLPHRVARQFGFDLDIPGQVARVNEAGAWACYTGPWSFPELYIPSSLGKAGITHRHMAWWNRSRAALEAGPS